MLVEQNKGTENKGTENMFGSLESVDHLVANSYSTSAGYQGAAITAGSASFANTNISNGEFVIPGAGGGIPIGQQPIR